MQRLQTQRGAVAAPPHAMRKSQNCFSGSIVYFKGSNSIRSMHKVEGLRIRRHGLRVHDQHYNRAIRESFFVSLTAVLPPKTAPQEVNNGEGMVVPKNNMCKGGGVDLGVMQLQQVKTSIGQ